MSKSLGNFMTLAELLEHADARSYRLLVLRSHYRSAIEVNEETLADADNALARIDACARRFASTSTNEHARADELESNFVATMEDDLNTPIAIGALFEAIRQANTLADRGSDVEASAIANRALRLFGTLGLEPRAQSETDGAVDELIAARDRAREQRQFDRADALRSDLEALGFLVEDTPSGTRVSRRAGSAG